MNSDILIMLQGLQDDNKMSLHKFIYDFSRHL